MLRTATATRLLATAARSSPHLAAGLVSSEATVLRLSGAVLTTSRRNLGTSKEIGAGLDDEKMRPGERSQVTMPHRRMPMPAVPVETYRRQVDGC